MDIATARRKLNLRNRLNLKAQQMDATEPSRTPLIAEA
jgi:hypothetical protein